MYVDRVPVDRTVSAETIMEWLFVTVCQISLAIRQAVDRNVFSPQNVLGTRRASTRNALIHAQEFVALTANVK